MARRSLSPRLQVVPIQCRLNCSRDARCRVCVVAQQMWLLFSESKSPTGAFPHHGRSSCHESETGLTVIKESEKRHETHQRLDPACTAGAAQPGRDAAAAAPQQRRAGACPREQEVLGRRRVCGLCDGAAAGHRARRQGHDQVLALSCCSRLQVFPMNCVGRLGCDWI